ncbi:unnamed protein product [Orchesella dallaii]|uniref:Uncharacterized protein n=1 Tax=Orchesella dallaii TaxID=48710 RepID=A0ABP1S2I7_9HEXA
MGIGNSNPNPFRNPMLGAYGAVLLILRILQLIMKHFVTAVFVLLNFAAVCYAYTVKGGFPFLLKVVEFPKQEGSNLVLAPYELIDRPTDRILKKYRSYYG